MGKIFATHGVSIESMELFSVACAQEKHYVLGKRPNNFCSSRKYPSANTLLKQTRNKEEQQQQTRALSCFASCAWETTKQKEEKKDLNISGSRKKLRN